MNTNKVGWKKLKNVIGMSSITQSKQTDEPKREELNENDDIELAITKLGSTVDDFGPFLKHLIYNGTEEDFGISTVDAAGNSLLSKEMAAIYHQYSQIQNEIRLQPKSSRPNNGVDMSSKPISVKSLANLI